MGNITVAVLGETGFAKDLGKAGTTSDITLYNLKRGEDTVTLIEPSRYPERLAPLFYSVALADRAILVVDAITPTFGEIVVMLDAIGLSEGYIILKNYLDRSSIAPLLRGTVVEQYRFIEEDTNILREELLAAAAKPSEIIRATCGVVAIDHNFNVKGIGTVVLGDVVRGRIRKHDMVNVLPAGKTAQVRSIQKHDDDFDDAVAGDRVGLALKNINAEELGRGDVLATDPELQISKEIAGTVTLSPFWKTPLKPGMVVHIGHWMQYLSGRITAVSPDSGVPQHLVVELDRELVFSKQDIAVIHHLDAGRLRVAGRLNLE
jgi:selenocysteine-specific translation elongation factor